MDNENKKACNKKQRKGIILTIIGLIVMMLLTLTKVIPTTSIAGYSVLVGITFFFIVEAVQKLPDEESGLRFKSFIRDMKKPMVIFLILFPILTAIITLIIGDIIFNGNFSSHVIERTSSMLSFDKLPLLILQVVIAALGEEIAWRGFFVGKSMKIFPFWLCAIVSSMLFAIGHIAVENWGLVFYDVFTIFIDSIIYAYIYKKTDNCLISTVSHILCNMTGIALTLIFM